MSSGPKAKIGVLFGDRESSSDREYLEAVRKAGGEPAVLRPSSSNSGNFSALSGLMLTGGEDVDPEFYHETKEPFCEEIDRRRDEYEFEALRHFFSKSKPVLAVCRGIQTLNVALGGTLYQDLEKQFETELLRPHRDRSRLSRAEKRALRHPVTVARSTKLHGILGAQFEVNSRHHQAVKQAAPGLIVTAKSPDGVIEAVESKEHPWVLGVEWHPESDEVYDQFAPLFQAFVKASSAGSI